MELVQTFTEAIPGNWNGGPKRVFVWKFDGELQSDTRGQFIRVGSRDANYWFHVAVGRTSKQTLGNARRRLTALTKRAGKECTYSYEEG